MLRVFVFARALPPFTAGPCAGLEPPEVKVEVRLANGLASFTLVGRADTEVKESRLRVRRCRREASSSRTTSA